MSLTLFVIEVSSQNFFKTFFSLFLYFSSIFLQNSIFNKITTIPIFSAFSNSSNSFNSFCCSITFVATNFNVFFLC
ncbi:unnamed protein product [Meloidogyne enterolobii]|uniref:Uncharacterized protein n=1 Tax=Meloidogyne enterolobii TaxID=390850 RepID=A0ACB0ZF01_MELEN